MEPRLGAGGGLLEPDGCIEFGQARGWTGREGEQTDASIRGGQEGREREQKEVQLGFWESFSAFSVTVLVAILIVTPSG